MSLLLIRRFYCTPLFNYNSYYIKHIKSLKKSGDNNSCKHIKSLKTSDDNNSYKHMYQALKYRIN